MKPKSYLHKQDSYNHSFPTFSKFSYLSFRERLMDFLNSEEGHDDDKQPLMGDCRNSEDVERCFWRFEIEDKQLKPLRSLLFSLRSLLFSQEECNCKLNLPQRVVNINDIGYDS